MKRFSGSQWLTRVALVALLVCVQPGRTRGQNPSLDPTFGSATLKSGFTPDPVSKKLTAGGDVKSDKGGVKAFVANAPDFCVDYTAGTFPLTIRAESDADTTLLINLPDGTWVADDDSGGKFNPSITFAKPQSGRYDIFVGTIKKENAPATLFITELAPKAKVANAEGEPNPNLDPSFGSVTLKGGFDPDPFTKNLTAGGELTTNLGNFKHHVAKAPDFRLNYTADKYILTIRVESAADTTLLINTPDGKWIADDDSGGMLNPSISFNPPMTGRYDIYVGTINDANAPANLIITELKK